MIINKNTDNPLNGDPITDDERDYLAQNNIIVPEGTVIIETSSNKVEAWYPDGYRTYYPVPHIDLTFLEVVIVDYLAMQDY